MRPEVFTPSAEAESALSGLLDSLLVLAQSLKLLVLGPIAAVALSYGATFLVSPVYTARMSFLPPQQQQSAATAALASLGALAGLAGSAANLKSPAEQYVALMQSTTVVDRLIEQYGLLKVYQVDYKADARKELANNVRITVGRRDGLITVEVDDESPDRAARMANSHVDELRRLGANLALTEAQQRRVFFEGQLRETRERLTQAQTALQGSGFTAGALKAEPKAAAEGYARLKAEVTAAEVRLQSLRRAFADDASEVQQQLATLAALRSQLARAEQTTSGEGADANYVGRYREFKYQEALFELFARQYELARVDEARDGALIQVVDVAAAPEKRSRPKRALIAVAAGAASLILLIGFVLARASWRRNLAGHPTAAAKAQALRAALRHR